MSDKLPNSVSSVVNKAVTANLLENLNNLSEYFVYCARVQRMRFTAFRAEGFSVEESLELCKTPIFSELSRSGKNEK